jgi:hypothetical protein
MGHDGGALVDHLEQGTGRIGPVAQIRSLMQAVKESAFERGGREAITEPRPCFDCAETADAGGRGDKQLSVYPDCRPLHDKSAGRPSRLDGELLDLTPGTLRCAPADPTIVANLVGLRVNDIAPPARTEWYIMTKLEVLNAYEHPVEVALVRACACMTSLV